jgi:Transglutaminase-like superfamily
LRLAGTSALASTCLRRSLALWVLLRRGQHEPILRIGVPCDDPRGEMHAWIEVEGRTIGDRPDVAERFLPFDLRGNFPDEIAGR